ncbi:hypothetical protein EDB85DRAFT_251466 [Lactarius pseudohatsudake]|nr:hypothetical protein EDB85DRAFT_251466 [Lactarius pseudohatsudake]
MGLERNVDVLVQLLQIDEPEEVAVIKMILIQYLELDSKVTLGVLCDQIVPPDDPMEDEDKTICERLEALVVAFLAQDTRKPLLAQLQGQRRGPAKQEGALIDTLIKAVSKSSAVDAAKIIEDILVFLPSFQQRTANMARERTGASTTRARHLSAQGGPRPWTERGEPGAVPRVP